MDDATLDKEFTYFQSILGELLSKGFAGKFALVQNQKLIDVFSTEKEAYEKGVEMFGTSIFLVQLISEDVKPESIQYLLHVHI